MCLSLKRHDALPFLSVGDQAMGTMFPIPGQFAQSPAGELSWPDYVHIGAHSAWSYLPHSADASIYGPGADLRPAPAPPDSATPPSGVCPA